MNDAESDPIDRSSRPAIVADLERIKPNFADDLEAAVAGGAQLSDLWKRLDDRS